MTTILTPRNQAEINQKLASDPTVSAWVGASAGSGKTKVLTDRVLRLLLQPGQAANRILCLTFTKAAATEMQTRLSRRLGEWACADDAILARQIEDLTGQVPSEAMCARARRLFAEVLELPGGMRISTIHAFCQSLLRSFPLEAGLPPQFSIVEEQEAAAMLAEAREAVLANTASDALAQVAGMVPPDDFASAVTSLARDRLRLAATLRDCHGLVGAKARLAQRLGIEAEADEASMVAELCQVPGSVLAAADALASHKNKGPRDLAAEIGGFLALGGEERAARWRDWIAVLFTDKGTPRKTTEAHPAIEEEVERIKEWQERASAQRLLAATSALLSLSDPMLAQFEARKRRAGLLAYDDLIATARTVLQDPGSAWVMFKMDGGLDHVLLDEAQDSNPAQWGIAAALTEEFFVGKGAERGPEDRPRTIFAVGDIKQSIYGFQGADAEGFGAWEQRFRERVAGLGDEFRHVQLNVSFRSTEPVLRLVDSVFAAGPACRGVIEAGAEQLRHLPDRMGHAGMVELWPLLRPAAKAKPEPYLVPETPEAAAGAEAQLAEALAARVAHMIRTETLPARCEPGAAAVPGAAGRPVRPGDILVLVRRRTGFVNLLVRALKERGVPVGGVDRLRLVEQIAVQDILALCDVLLLPEDDLQLAALLKSPLVGLSEDDLFRLAHGRDGSLWAALAAHRGGDDALGRAADWVSDMMGRADFITPHALLSEILGEHRGRAKLLARLGPDAADPLDEIMNAALTYERQHPPSLQGFVHWLRRGGAEVKREAESAADAVRIMTVHGAKGLQAPVVIIPDVGSGRGDKDIRWDSAGGIDLPFWAPKNRKEFRASAYTAVLDDEEQRRAQEENRLLYVALTRAEDRLLVCGWGKDAGEWHDLVAQGFARLLSEGHAERLPFDPAAFGAPPACDFGGGEVYRLACAQTVPPVAERGTVAAEAALPAPEWAYRPAPPESAEIALSPSILPGEKEPPVAAPHGAADPGGRRFRRGRLIHALLQHLPGRPAAELEAAARRFLARPGHRLTENEQDEVFNEVRRLISAPEIAAAFSLASLAEAPIAGRINGRLISGQVDRLVVTPTRILVLDYKTNRPPPARIEGVSPIYLRQMAAYRAVLADAFPGREISCALIWTWSARLMLLPSTLLDQHAP